MWVVRMCVSMLVVTIKKYYRMDGYYLFLIIVVLYY